MSYDKAITHGKSKRKPYRNAKAVSGQCRNHGGCSYCKGNRTYQRKKEEMRMEELSHEDYDTE